MKQILILLIHGYRWLISPFFPPSCRHTPSCSRYAIYVIEAYGPIKGIWLTIKRLFKCHPYYNLEHESGYGVDKKIVKSWNKNHANSETSYKEKQKRKMDIK
jgi:putative membrane protein insertion efficiency factor